MKLLVSDYDGTIKTFDNNPSFIEKINFKMNVKAINDFITKGNKFVISTGRSTESIKKEIQKYNISYSYLTTYDGSVIFNGENELINADYLEIKYLNDLKEILKKYKDLIKIYKYNNVGITNLDDNLIALTIKAKDFDILKKLINDIKEIDSSKIYSLSPFIREIYIKENVNKSDGIEQLLLSEKIEVERKDIFTVGDGKNDIEMLNNYNGYAMCISYPRVFFTTPKKVSSVHRLIKKIN